jgi:hypothetical protein
MAGAIGLPPVLQQIVRDISKVAEQLEQVNAKLLGDGLPSGQQQLLKEDRERLVDEKKSLDRLRGELIMAALAGVLAPYLVISPDKDVALQRHC